MPSTWINLVFRIVLEADILAARAYRGYLPVTAPTRCERFVVVCNRTPTP
jgi:hypothetical protein